MAGEFASLVESNQIPFVLKGIEAAVLKTFAQDKSPGRIILVSGAADRGPTQNEIKHRTKICLHIFQVLRGDMQWSVQRAVDHLATFLRAQLDGISWEPEARRATWASGSV